MSGLRDHPKMFDVGFLAGVFDQSENSLDGFEYAPVGTGQVGDSYRVTLAWREGIDAPLSVIAKCPAAAADSRETARNLHLYEIETQFYTHFGQSCDARVPQLYLADYDAASGDGLLLLEDLAPAVQIAQMDGCTIEQLTAALGQAAALHKSHWNDPQLMTHAWLTYSLDDERRAFIRDLVPAIYPEWRARYEERIDSDILDMGADLVARFAAYITPKEAPIVLAHGDLRLDNMLYSDAEGRPVLLDWQTVSAAPPMGDIAYCISTSLADASLRAAHEETLVAQYHAQLGDCVGGYGVEAAWADYRRAAFSGFIMALISAMLVERTVRGDEMFAVMAERSGWQALHLDALSLI